MKKPFYKRKWFIGVVVLFILGGILNAMGEEEESVNINTNKGEEIVDTKQETKEQGPTTNITGELNIEFKDNKAIATVTTNAVDGSIFETSLTNSQLNAVSDFINIENGQGSKEFDIPAEWESEYISGIAMMRFNLDEHPQPDNVKELYGEKGEKLEGEFAEENNLGGKNVNLAIVTVPYPDLETVKETQDKLLLEVLDEMIELSNGVIVHIQPHFTDGDWSSVAVTVSDAWYNSQEHEKERFAEQIRDTIVTIIKNAGKVEQDKTVSVYFFDTYKKELASPKITGGYKIKR